MSELKDYDIMDIEAMDDERLEKSESGKIQVTRVYIKSEADKVIAELESENATQKEQLAIYVESEKRRMLDEAKTQFILGCNDAEAERNNREGELIWKATCAIETLKARIAELEKENT